MSLFELFTKLKGGTGSGHWGHEGRPGKRGGSGRGTGGLSSLATTPTLRALLTGKQTYNGDSLPVVEALFKELNYKAKPQVVDNLDRHISNGDTELYRGVKGDDAEETARHVQDFKQGELFIGRGIHGSGTYTAIGAEGISVAKQYSRSAGDAGIIRMALSKDAKVITDSDLSSKLNTIYNETHRKSRQLSRAANKEFDKGNDARAEALLDRYARLQNQGNDLYNALKADSTVVAAAMGYDAIQVGSYMIVLNRGKVKVEV